MNPIQHATTPHTPATLSPSGGAGWVGRVAPGLILSCGTAGAAILLARAETAIFGRAWLEALVLAILVGTAVRTAWSPGARWRDGITFSAKTVLEVAVLLLGASISARTLMAAGPPLLTGIVGVVTLALAMSYGIGRLLGLPHRMATLVACGNSICGNSAIAAVAPVIGACADDVAASIAFTAVLGVAAVLCLPLLPALLHLSGLQYGVLAGLTVYAVPQVLAATAPLGLIAVHTGTLVKLVRVLMLGPVVLVLSLMARRAAPRDAALGTKRLQLHRLVPWFIVGFLALGGLRSADLVPHAALAPAAFVASVLTVIAMAALGLGTDLKMVTRAGGRVTAAVTLSLLALGGISFGLIRALGIG